MAIDYEIFMQAELQPEEITVMKVIKTDQPQNKAAKIDNGQGETNSKESSLTVQGQSEYGDVIFLYSHVPH